MTRVHLVASQPHYRRHLASVWRHLPDDMRGDKITLARRRPRPLPAGDVVMVAGRSDLAAFPRNITIYQHHGAGQSYRGDRRSARHPNYAGARHPATVIGYIGPRQEVLNLWRKPGVVAGCPALDGFRRCPQGVAVITFHFDAVQVSPEARSARPHYLEALPAMAAHLRACGFKVLAHRHPRDRQAHRLWRHLGIEFEPDLEQCLRVADLFIADNTSAMYEAALLDIPVVALNAPWYRRDISHGLRFWDWIPGIDIDDDQQFLSIDWRAHIEDDLFAQQRRATVNHVYGGNPGGKAAARWVTELVAAL